MIDTSDLEFEFNGNILPYVHVVQDVEFAGATGWYDPGRNTLSVSPTVYAVLMKTATAFDVANLVNQIQHMGLRARLLERKYGK